MTVTKQTTIWCDHPDPRGIPGHTEDRVTPRCVEWVSVDASDAVGARREARRLGWSVRKGIGDCCPFHRKPSPRGVDGGTA